MSAKWHHLRERALESLTSSMGRISTSRSSRWRWCWPPWTFGRLSTGLRRLHHPMWTPKSSRSTTCTRRRPCPSLASTWWIVNFTTLRGARDLRSHGRHLQHPRDAELVQHPFHSPQVLHVQDARGRGPSRPHQQVQGTAMINSLAWRCS